MSEQEYPITLEGKKKLDEELKHLVSVERENVKVAIATARAHGDLKENSDYHSAKERQSHIEGKILELQSKLARARVVNVALTQSSKIIFGATVTLFDKQKDNEVIYQIVGEDEADISVNKISYTSPLGKALIGKEEGDQVIVRAPKGNIEYEIVSFEYK